MCIWCFCWAKQAFDSLLPSDDVYIKENYKMSSFFFQNSEAQMSSNYRMTHMYILNSCLNVPYITFHVPAMGGPKEFFPYVLC